MPADAPPGDASSVLDVVPPPRRGTPAEHASRRACLDDLDQRDPVRVATFVRLVDAIVARYHRAEVRGAGRVPEGAALVVGNHNAGAWSADMFLVGAALYRAGGIDGAPYGLAHEVVLDLPVAGALLRSLGAVRASHDNARRLFDRGRRVLVYPGGDLEAMRPWRDRDRIVFGGRKGYVRLALRSGVPIVPVVAAGAHETFLVVDDLQWLARLIRADRWLRVKVWPLTLCLPWGVTLGPLVPYLGYPARILVEFLDPICFSRSGDEAARDDAYVDACDAQVRASMQAALSRLAAERRSGQVMPTL